MKNRVLLVATLAALAGCGSALRPAPSYDTYLPTLNTITAPVNPSGETFAFPSAGGYSGTFIYSASNAAESTSMTATTLAGPQANLVPAGQMSPGTMLVAFEFTLNANVTFSNWKRLLTTITIPSSVLTAGDMFNGYGYDRTANIGESPGVVTGTSINLGSGLGPVTLFGGHTYLSVLTEQ